VVVSRAVTVARRPESLPVISLPDHEILEGEPDARCVFTAKSADDGAAAGFWACGVGRYQFVFDYDEFVYLVEGEVVITEVGGDRSYTLTAGDTAHFPQGTTSIWQVTRRMTKYFVARAPFDL
jgi:uncharacterized cupin superfamily protein